MLHTMSLQRFVDAQEPVYSRVLSELRAGSKTTHWIWFVFPQIAGLGHSPMSQKFSIASLDEARAYLAHAVLGARLQECTQLVLAAKDKPIEQIMGYPDDLKFRSSMTLFARAAAPDNSIFEAALRQFFAGEPDPLTLQKIGEL